jgi:hypothetical protein
MSLNGRIMAGLMLAVVIPVVIGTTSFLNMSRMAAVDQQLYFAHSVPISELSRIAVSFQRVRVMCRDLLESDGTPEEPVLEHGLDQLSADIEASTNAFGERELLPDERAALSRCKPPGTLIASIYPKSELWPGQTALPKDGSFSAATGTVV